MLKTFVELMNKWCCTCNLLTFNVWHHQQNLVLVTLDGTLNKYKNGHERKTFKIKPHLEAKRIQCLLSRLILDVFVEKACLMSPPAPE